MDSVAAVKKAYACRKEDQPSVLHMSNNNIEGSYGTVACLATDFAAINGYDEELLPVAVQDWDLMDRLLAFGKEENSVKKNIKQEDIVGYGIYNCPVGNEKLQSKTTCYNVYVHCQRRNLAQGWGPCPLQRIVLARKEELLSSGGGLPPPQDPVDMPIRLRFYLFGISLLGKYFPDVQLARRVSRLTATSTKQGAKIS